MQSPYSKGKQKEGTSSFTGRGRRATGLPPSRQNVESLNDLNRAEMDSEHSVNASMRDSDNIARARRESEVLRSILLNRDYRQPTAEPSIRGHQGTSSQRTGTQRLGLHTARYFDLVASAVAASEPPILESNSRGYQPFSPSLQALSREVPERTGGTVIASDDDDDDNDNQHAVYSRDSQFHGRGGLSQGVRGIQAVDSHITSRALRNRVQTSGSRANLIGTLTELLARLSQEELLTGSELDNLLHSTTSNNSRHIYGNFWSHAGGTNEAENEAENPNHQPMDISPAPSLYPSVPRKSSSHMSVDDPPLNNVHHGNVSVSEGSIAAYSSIPASVRSSRSSASRWHNRRAMSVLTDGNGYVLPKKAYEAEYVLEDLNSESDQVIFQNRFLPTFLSTISLRRNPLIDDGLEEIMEALWKIFFPHRDWYAWSRYCRFLCIEHRHKWIMDFFGAAKEAIFEYLDELDECHAVPKTKRRSLFVNELLSVIEPIYADPANNIEARAGRAMRMLWKSCPSEFYYTEYQDRSEWKFKGFFRNKILTKVFSCHLRATLGSRIDCGVSVYQTLRTSDAFPELRDYGGMFEREFRYNPRGALSLTAGAVYQIYSNFTHRPNGDYVEHHNLRNSISANGPLSDNIFYFVDLIGGMSLRQWTLVMIETEEIMGRDDTLNSISSMGLYPGPGQGLDQTQISRFERHRVAQTDEADDL